MFIIPQFFWKNLTILYNFSQFQARRLSETIP